MKAAPVTVLTVHDLRLSGMEFQPDIGEPTTDRVPHEAGLPLGHTMDHRIVCEALEGEPREFPVIHESKP